MRNLLVLILAILCLATAGCKKTGDKIIGCWVNPVLGGVDEKTVLDYKKSNTLQNNFEGIEFFNDGRLIERKNMGWCGTPPIQYGNYSGNWHTQNDSIIIDVAYWGGMERKIWKIINVTNTSLKVEVLYWEIISE